MVLEKKGTPLIGKDLGRLKVSSNLDGLFLIDVLVDFTDALAADEHLDYVAKYKKALVLGTTALTDGGNNETPIFKVLNSNLVGKNGRGQWLAGSFNGALSS